MPRRMLTFPNYCAVWRIWFAPGTRLPLPLWPLHRASSPSA